MRRVLLILGVCAMSLTAWADFAATPHLAGEFDGWDPTTNPMIETAPGSGVWTFTVTGQAPNARQEFKVTDGSWDSAFPGANSWYYTDDSGEVTVTFNANTVSDGWLPEQNRLIVDTDPGNWTIVGDFGGSIQWNNAAPEMAMTYLGNGLYSLSKTLTAGTYNWKATNTGTWDAVGAERSIDAGNLSLTVLESSENVIFYLDALTGTIGVNLDISRDDFPHDPDPETLSVDVAVDGLELSWTVGLDPNGVVEPNMIGGVCKVYIGTGTDPNIVYHGTADPWDVNFRATYPLPGAQKDTLYSWRVDMVRDDGQVLSGFIWTFETELTIPIITEDPNYQVVDAGTTAEFSVLVISASVPGYQWYKYVDGISDTMLTDAGNVSGSQTATLSISNVQLADEGGYYCIVSNDSPVQDTSETALLGVKRKLAYWPFENSDPDSQVAGSPASFLYNDPAFVSGGASGDGMEFDNDPNSEDMLYVDPDEAAYFDICSKSMTVGCWIKSSFAAQWGPMVARNGDGGEGWQLRHSGKTLDKACFTTRGTSDNVDLEDGTPTNQVIYDGNWHYVVGTYDGTTKKIYVDGVVNRVYKTEDGSIDRESDDASGLINGTLSPLSLGGRVTGNPNDGLNFDGSSVSPCVLDEVEIYNYALDATAIAQMYADISGNPVCPAPLDYDLNNDCMVNLDDFALLASGWLTDTSVQP